jgi:DNA (cytosine-5)-methyltransferase 1
VGDQFTFVDLFAGIGGFHHALAAKEFGGRCVLAVEIDQACQDVYEVAFNRTRGGRRKRKSTRLVSDIREITRREDDGKVRDATPDEIRELVPPHDVLCAGFPCQPFSKSGAQQGLRDQTRGTLFFDIMEIVRARKPRFLILENVPNLVGPRHTDTWRLIIDSLRDAGYRVSRTPVVVSPHRLPPPLGSPQVRDRVFILAAHDPQRAKQEAAPLINGKGEPTWSPKRWVLDRHIDRHRVAEQYAIRPIERTWLNAWDAFLKGVPDDHLPGFPIWVDAWTDEARYDITTPRWKADFLEKNAAFYRTHKSFLRDWLKVRWPPEDLRVDEFPLSRRKFEWQARSVHPTREGRTLWDLLIHLRPSGIRVKPADYFPALVAITQTSIVGELERRITPREAAALQGIPFWPFDLADTPDGEIYKQLGNAVNVGVVKYVAATLFSHYQVPWGHEVLQLEIPEIAG